MQDHLGAVWAVIVARTSAPKSRLAPVLSPDLRRELALAMLTDVLDTCRTCTRIAGTLAVVDLAEAQHLASERGAWVLLEAPGGLGGMNAAVSAGVAAAAGRGANTVLVLPGDVPLLSHSDIAALLRAASSGSKAVVIGCSADGSGTNALLLRPPQVIAPSFGPPSPGRHLALGHAAGATTRLVRNLDLALDVDTPADLEALRGRGARGATGRLLERHNRDRLLERHNRDAPRDALRDAPCGSRPAVSQP